jgi:hypothetical protein
MSSKHGEDTFSDRIEYSHGTVIKAAKDMSKLEQCGFRENNHIFSTLTLLKTRTIFPYIDQK